MTRLTTVKLTLSLAGLLIFLYGTTAADRRVQGVGLAFVAAAFLLRFVRRKTPGG
ncbi:MAG: hypothetical protein M3068_05570 [Gemmatimonadota bacterium]|nr:hypothetical protein [Gemmatimonadota bacterium]